MNPAQEMAHKRWKGLTKHDREVFMAYVRSHRRPKSKRRKRKRTVVKSDR